ncbi:hypothetical protein HN51_031019 [Arachis hypogaea]|uniref:Uncharacterized protein n=2 Tax=Arachis TaxID=3817 RepID=A0A445B8U3_ARAHY|nr:protein DOWNSTREAM OF FLC [Arachis duranensis]XP_025625844.1 protein DOWNSTREAM OF FLC [Arachis hypogaea]QHO15607.1 Protein DOWNSTREAM OF FLC [Arachis hypogaea]RYR35079.1 hypothetical protein Ahy_A10g050205 [Arachis hypogaea]
MMMGMNKLVVLVLVSLSFAFATEACHVKGRVYCDTCRFGFETKATFYIPGATVAIQCKNKKTMKVEYYTEVKTDNTGTYGIEVDKEFNEHNCESVLVHSPVLGCNKADPGRSKATLVLSHYKNGLLNHVHYANNLGFLKDEALPQCQQLLKYYFSDV